MKTLLLLLFIVPAAQAATIYTVVPTSNSASGPFLVEGDTETDIWAVAVGKLKVVTTSGTVGQATCPECPVCSTATATLPVANPAVIVGPIPCWRPSANSTNGYKFQGINENGVPIPARGEWVKCP